MAYDFKKVNVLVTESTHTMFDLTQAVLAAFGVGRIYSAFDHNSGFRSFCQNNPDLVILDWLEDPLNGLELARKIRTHKSSPNPYVPIVMMSGHSSVKRILAARDAGVSAFMAKPFTAKSLFNRIEYLIEKPRPFVKAPDFIGPDRRTGARKDYQGPDRRRAA